MLGSFEVIGILCVRIVNGVVNFYVICEYDDESCIIEYKNWCYINKGFSIFSFKWKVNIEFCVIIYVK